MFLNSKLDAKRQKPAIEENFLDKLILLKELYDLCDIRRIKYPAISTFNFRQKHCKGFIHFKLDCFYIQ